MTSAQGIDTADPPWVCSDTAVHLLERMVCIPSPSGSEARLARFMARAMDRIGLSARIDEVGNVIGECGTGAGPSILLLGHLDTVPGTGEVRRSGNLIYGRGTVDAKGALAAFLVAAARCRRLPARITVAGAVEEETPGSRGAVHLTRTLDCPDFVIVGEPSGWSRIVVAYRGRLNLRFTAECAPAHPASPHPRAAELAVACWQAALELLKVRPGHVAFADPGVTLTSLSGDAERAEMELDVRIPVGFDVNAYVNALRARCPDGRLDVVNAVPAVHTRSHSRVVRALSAAIRRHGGTPRRVVKTGTSDMNTIADSWSTTMATYGPGDCRLDHSSTEHLALDEYLRAVDVLVDVLSGLAGGPRDDPTAQETPT